MNAPGPGATLLAELTGHDVEEVATRPGVALRAVAEFMRDMARLAADRSSPTRPSGAPRRAEPPRPSTPAAP